MTETPDLNSLKRKKASFKSTLTRFNNFLDSIVASELSETSILELELRLSKIKNLLPQFLDIQLDIEALDPEIDNTSETDSFEKAYYAAVARANQHIKQNSTNLPNILDSVSGRDGSDSSIGSSQRLPQNDMRSNDSDNVNPCATNKVSIRLPIIDLPKFSGKYEKWLEFRDLYLSLIHECKELEPIQKFHYLRASLDGPAAQCIKSLEFTSTNYNLAWNILKERFENKQLIVHNYIKSIFTIGEIRADSALAFRDLVDNISKNLRSLNSLGVPTEQWDPLIIFMIVSKLDVETVRDWERQSFKNELPTLDELKSFLSSRADLLEKLNFRKNKGEIKTKPQKAFVTSSSQNKSFSCYICKKPHSIYKCSQFLSLPIQSRREKVSNLKLCFNCLKGNHLLNNCTSSSCKYCNEKHHSLLHEVLLSNSPACSSSQQITDLSSLTTERRNTSCSSCSYLPQVLLSTVQVQIIDKGGNFHICKALLDNGSMSNFISESLVHKLNLSFKEIQSSVVGIGQKQSNLNAVCDVRIKSIQNNFTKELTCLVIANITDILPSRPFDPTCLNIPSHVRLADPSFHKPSQIDLLIGADTFWEVMCKGTIYLGAGKPVVQKTRLGWIVSGSLGDSNTDRKSICNLSRNIDTHLLKFWEIEEISPKYFTSEEESLAEDHFVRTFKRLSSGRFVVSIPLKESISKLGDSMQTARKQFFSLERRFQINPVLKKMYVEFMNEYINLGHMSKYRNFDNEVTYFAPHHGVLREDSSTTKLRVVFNCSAPSSTGYSYNSLQLVGPEIQRDLASIILQFRSHKYAVTADISKMYRQIEVDESFKRFQLIFWRENPEDELIVYALNTVTYGQASASFLAKRCLKQLAIDFQNRYPKACKDINKSFYMDDWVSGTDTVTELLELCQQVSSILKSGCFELRKWKSNSKEVLAGIEDSIPSSDEFNFAPLDSGKTLGLFWSGINDSFTFHIQLDPDTKRITKRSVLAQIMRIFDPIGLISPVVITAKIMLQSLWLLKLSWDHELPDDIKRSWLSLKMELPKLNVLEIPRHVKCSNAISVQLHGFADASQRAYGACLYVRSVDTDSKVHSHLLCSKTRVAPLKSLSIPRLELCGALLLSQLFHKVQSSMTLNFDSFFLWSDSTIVLAWIRSSPHELQTFVANRVSEIQQLTRPEYWRYVPTSLNPADILSRGLSPKQLLECSSWFIGPSYLSLSYNVWPADISLQSSAGLEDLPETRKCTQTLLQVEENELFPFHRFSSLTRLRRVVAYFLRFINNARKSKEQREYNSLTHDELLEGMKVLVNLSQRESFSNEFLLLSENRTINAKSKLFSLCPFLDGNIIRVGGRLKNSTFSFQKKHPAVLSSKHQLTRLIFKHEHVNLLHCGPQSLLASVRESFWPVSGKLLAKETVRKCIVCFKFKPKSLTPIMGNLPEPRVSPRAPFSDTGVDYAGPFFVKNNKGRGSKTSKCYLCLFICLTIKAVHLELVTELSTYSFLEAFQRFISRRGKPLHMYSDNGRNFVGANNHLKDLGKFLKSNRKEISEHIENKYLIKWHFIAAYSPHQGGLWEAGVKSAKHHIKRVLSNSSLTFESFNTVIIQIESILNSRPLTELSADPNDLEVLTPAHFLIGKSLQQLPYEDLRETPSNRLSHYHQLERLKQHFWTRWSKEYITQLQERRKWRTKQDNIFLGCMVLIRDENLPPYKWHLGRVVALHPGKDNVVRVASVNTKSGVIKRAVQKLCPLPIKYE